MNNTRRQNHRRGHQAVAVSDFNFAERYAQKRNTYADCSGKSGHHADGKDSLKHQNSPVDRYTMTTGALVEW